MSRYFCISHGRNGMDFCNICFFCFFKEGSWSDRSPRFLIVELCEIVEIAMFRGFGLVLISQGPRNSISVFSAFKRNKLDDIHCWICNCILPTSLVDDLVCKKRGNMKTEKGMGASKDPCGTP